LKPAPSIAPQLGCETNAQGGIAVDELGRTSVKGVYAAGDTSTVMQAQLIFAAANGSKAAMGVVADFITTYFEQ
jgi:alkyl hydroperoxide reductase subunit AhpF